MFQIKPLAEKIKADAEAKKSHPLAGKERELLADLKSLEKKLAERDARLAKHEPLREELGNISRWTKKSEIAEQIRKTVCDPSETYFEALRRVSPKDAAAFLLGCHFLDDRRAAVVAERERIRKEYEPDALEYTQKRTALIALQKVMNGQPENHQRPDKLVEHGGVVPAAGSVD